MTMSKPVVRLMIGLPSYSWSVKLGTLRSLLTDLVALQKTGAAFDVFDEAGNTEIGAARQEIIDAFLASDCTDLIFVDDDVCWQAGAIQKLLGHKVDLVGGVYPKRKDPIEFPINWLARTELHAVDGLLEVASLPTGFLRISRQCATQMHEAFGALMFDNIREGDRRFSEDISFCKRWRSIGGQVWADPEIKMGHIGNKLFDGHLGDWLRNR